MSEFNLDGFIRPLKDLVFGDVKTPDEYRKFVYNSYFDCLDTSLCPEWLAGLDGEQLALVLDKLFTSQFYIDPASTTYHGSFKSGLVLHSLAVAYYLIKLVYQSELRTSPLYSMVNLFTVGMVHDLCKVGTFESYFSNKKDDATGLWHKVPGIRHKEDVLTFGHGVESLKRWHEATGVVHFNDELEAAVRWHMGMYDITPTETYAFNTALKRYPLVLLTCTADLQAAFWRGV
jgi:hypothetical protein